MLVLLILSMGRMLLAIEVTPPVVTSIRTVKRRVGLCAEMIFMNQKV